MLTQSNLINNVFQVDEEPLTCLNASLYSEMLQAHFKEVQWISLSVTGNLYHYVVFGDVIVFCDE